jgi:hypothetical protein
VVEARKEQAQKAVHLMRETAEKVAREEERKKGLIIVEAQYGEMVNDTPGYELYPVAGERLIDVTIPLQALVNDSQLRIYSGKVVVIYLCTIDYPLIIDSNPRLLRSLCRRAEDAQSDLPFPRQTSRRLHSGGPAPDDTDARALHC